MANPKRALLDIQNPLPAVLIVGASTLDGATLLLERIEVDFGGRAEGHGSPEREAEGDL
jgi:hypothetical protein